jgi:Flp pilus assembly protein TadD
MNSILKSLFLLAVPFGLYWSAVHGEFHYDDFHHILDNQSIRDMKNLGRFFIDPGTFSSQPGVEMYRPVVMATYALNYYLGQLEPLGWHLLNIILHGINTLLVFAISLRLLRSKGGAFFAALVFAVHPAAGESVNYISSRSSLLLATFFLSAFLSYQKGTDPEKNQRWPWLVYSNILFILALLTKETAIVFPALIVVYEFIFFRIEQPHKKWLNQMSLRLIPLIIFAMTYLILRKLLLDAILSTADTRPVWVNLLTESKAYLFYLRILLWPVSLSVDHGFTIERSILAPKVLFSLAGLLLIPAIFIRTAGSRESSPRLIAFSIAWYILALLPTSSIVPLNMLVNERRLYLPMAAFAVIAGLAYIHIRPRAPRFTTGICIFLTGIFSALVLCRNPVWNHEVSLWRDAFRKAPENFRPAHGLGDHYFFDEKLKLALKFYRQANRLEPEKAMILHNIGLILDMLGEPVQAVAELKRAHEIEPENPRISFSLANAYEHTGAIQLARFHMEEACILDPDYAMAHNNLGKIYYIQGDKESAEKEYRKALRIEPEQELANYNLGILLSEKGRHAEALKYLHVAFQANPLHPDNAFQLGLCLYRLHKWPEARDAFRKAVDLNPGWKNAWYNLGLTEQILRNREAAEEAFQKAGKSPTQRSKERKE